jgi:hypothetical protein
MGLLGGLHMAVKRKVLNLQRIKSQMPSPQPVTLLNELAMLHIRKESDLHNSLTMK